MNCYSGQTGMFFKRSENGYVFHYVNFETDTKNQAYQNWLSLPLHEDFIDCLKKIGRPPPSSTHALIEEIKESQDKTTKIQDQECNIQELKGENEDLKSENSQLKARLD